MKMVRAARFLVVFGWFLVVISAESHAPASCGVLTFEEDAEDRWEAALDVKVAEQLNGVWIKVDLDKKADVLITNLGETTSTNNQNYIIRRPDLRVAPGEAVRAKLTVKFNGTETAPNITRIILNGRIVCPVEPEDVDIRQHELSNQPVPIDKESCGIVPEAQSLIYNGELSSEGAWPWHVAIMKISPPRVMYNCGGSIISDNYILTAAHCVTFHRTRTPVGNQNFLIYIGVTKLTNLDVPSVKVSTAAEIFIPDDYNPETYFNDIALIKLSTNLQFNNFIRPVCLWSGDDAESTITSRKGTVVGWGIDHRNQSFSSDLRHAEIPVVPLQTCRERGDFYRKHTTDKTYCAGGMADTSVCNGDSGGGMVFRKQGTVGSNSVWQIRGVVSVNRKQELNSVCNTKSLAIFTDVAKHLEWIRTVTKVG